MPSSQFSWQEGADQGAFYWPYFYPWGSWGGFSGYDYYPNLYLPCTEAIPSSSSSITKTVSQENGSLPLVAGIRTTPNIQVTGSVSHTTPAVSSFRNPKPIQSGKAKVSLSTVPTISKASQHNNTRAIPTCLGIMQGLTNPLPGRPGQVLNPAGQVCSVFTTPGRASVKKSPGQLKVRVFTVKKSDQKMSINIDN